ncbi:hypothetical protein LEMLEM_LOCUS8912 [Lemmus lemmus]
MLPLNTLLRNPFPCKSRTKCHKLPNVRKASFTHLKGFPNFKRRFTYRSINNIALIWTPDFSKDLHRNSSCIFHSFYSQNTDSEPGKL